MKMGSILRKVLKAFCAGNQWSYSVFWKIGCQNTNLLIWEGYYFEPVSCPEVPFGEWEGCWGSSEASSSQLGIKAGDRVQLLINQMMMNNQVNVVGEGMVGRAAFTGNHQWILARNHIRDAHPPEVQNEVHLQFSAGMQTVAVIPVLPHGVVQLGSSLAIMENLEFVNYVKNLILQLGCIPGALLSDNYGTMELTEKIGKPVPYEMLDSSGTYNEASSTPFAGSIYNQQSGSSQPSRQVDQLLGYLGRQSQHNAQASASIFQTPSSYQTLGKSHDHCKPNLSPVLKPNLPFGDQMGNKIAGAEVIPSNPDAWMNQRASLYDSGTAFNYQPIIDRSTASCGDFKLIEQQIMTDVSAQDHVINNINEENVDQFLASQQSQNGGLTAGFVPMPLLEGSELHGGMDSQISSVAVPCSVSNPKKLADSNLYSTHLAGVGLKNANSLKVEEGHLSSLLDQLTASHMLSGGSIQGHGLSDLKHVQNNLASRKERVHNDLFQALNNSSTCNNEHMPLSRQIPGFINDCQKHDNEDAAPRSNAKFEDACAQPPSGDDLFDILGVDFKNKLLNGNGNNLHANGQNLGKGASYSMNETNVSSDFYSVTESLSNTASSSGMGTEHLLDAVVTRAHSVAKQISDDNVSCRTTVTSSSSVPSSSPSCTQVNLSHLVQGELFGLSKPMAKARTVGSGSLQSGCSKDDGGSCSQTTSIYGSHIGSWIEQGQNVKRDSSVSTAYSKRNDEMTKSNRKRLKPGENPRPRPKDRQMIQDRVKELREIVPNGAKCSIDALLERTIKHMLFLQSVTKHADKLKQTAESKMINKEGGSLLKDNLEGGATWAFEVGSQSMVCPILVEDLNPPRQMLVEMLCEERGFFLEIADLIRGLGLSILKGVMETRNGKIWARFAVEANRDVTRMEIFMSLVRLLEQTVGNTLVNAFENSNMMVHHSFPQATSIPATGRPSSL